jgi:hypothetical protein
LDDTEIWKNGEEGKSAGAGLHEHRQRDNGLGGN